MLESWLPRFLNHVRFALVQLSVLLLVVRAVVEPALAASSMRSTNLTLAFVSSLVWQAAKSGMKNRSGPPGGGGRGATGRR